MLGQCKHGSCQPITDLIWISGFMMTCADGSEPESELRWMRKQKQLPVSCKGYGSFLFPLS